MDLNLEKSYAVGIDIGGTNTVFGIVDMRGTVIASDSIKTQAYEQADDYADVVCRKLTELIDANGGKEKIRGVGIGAPNGNYYTGAIEFTANLPWKGIVPLAAMFEERLGIPTALTYDANAAAVGEMTYGAARGMKDFIMITLGTGVGSGIVINGQVVYGHDGFAGELGHVIVRRENGRLCGCGRKGCLETYCSATGVARTARELLTARTEPSLLRSVPAEEITSKDKTRSVITCYRRLAEVNPPVKRVYPKGLDPDFRYFVEEQGVTLSGSTIMNAGIIPAFPDGDFVTVVFHLEKAD